jgi:TRAP transporter TAXI family solute receptor
MEKGICHMWLHRWFRGSARRNKHSSVYSFLLILALVVALTPPGICADVSNRLIRIGTGGATGVYYPIGQLIAQGLTGPVAKTAGSYGQKRGISGYVGVAQNSAGSIENVNALVAGEIEAGLVQADVAAWAYNGENVFAGHEDARKVRAVASLYAEKFHIVTRKDANIMSVHDLKGKRISIDEIGSGTLAVMRIVLDAHQMSEKDLLPVYLKPVFTNDKFKTGDLHGFVMMAGVPMAAVSQLVDVGLDLVPIAPDMVDQITARYPHLVPGNIPAGVYPGISNTSTVQVFALLLVSADMEDGLVYQVTAALWSDYTQAQLRRGHKQGSAVTLETALDGLSIPLHPGAERYYRERNLIAKGN